MGNITAEQRKYYFGGVVEQEMDFYNKHPAALFTDVAEALKEDGGKELIHGLNKLMCNGGRTTQFKTDERGTAKDKMAAFIDRVREGFWNRHTFDITPAGMPPITTKG